MVLKVLSLGSNFNVINYLNEYEIIKLIKSGGYGSVYLAQHVIHKNSVAVKKIDVSNFSSEDLYNISRESVYLESFKHPNIIRFINSFTYENNFYTIMDLAKGGELSNYLSEAGRLSEKETKRIFQQIHEAVKYIHSRNVIHRDLKPNNILFLEEDKQTVVLIDFGISGSYTAHYKETVMAGTTRYIPPEFASGELMSSSPKIDLWAMGIILYLMLIGYFPWEGMLNYLS